MRICPARDQLLALIAGDHERRGLTREHVDRCANCRKTVDRYSQTLQVAAQYATFASTPPVQEAAPTDRWSQHTDQLAALAFEGDENALQSLKKLFDSKLRGLFRRRATSDAEAAHWARETWTQLIEQRDDFARSGKFLPILLAVAHRVRASHTDMGLV